MIYYGVSNTQLYVSLLRNGNLCLFYLIYYTIEYKNYSQSSMIPHLSFSLKITTKTKISDCYLKKNEPDITFPLIKGKNRKPFH